MFVRGRRFCLWSLAAAYVFNAPLAFAQVEIGYDRKLSKSRMAAQSVNPYLSQLYSQSVAPQAAGGYKPYAAYMQPQTQPLPSSLPPQQPYYYQPAPNQPSVPVKQAAITPSKTVIGQDIPQAAPTTGVQDDVIPVNFQADQMRYDEVSKTVTAEGNVFLEQDGQFLRADRISYNVEKDTARAYGHVVLLDEQGNEHYAQQLILKDQFKDGIVRKFTSYMRDGSTFTSESGLRSAGQKTVLQGASYTACEVCKVNPDKPPVWRIRADEVTHDQADKSISYKNAYFETYGVPVAYFPYFSHPDGSEKQKSGFLPPGIGYKSKEGAVVDSSYYWAISPSEDLTTNLRVHSNETPLLYSNYRKRWQNAELDVTGGITHSGYKDRTAGKRYTKDDEVRGHIDAHALWNVNDKWRTGADIQWASDDKYMDHYDFESKDVLESEVYAERFDHRDYAAARLVAFQDTRTLDEPVDQPEILPEIEASFVSDPGAVPVLGGTAEFTTDYLGLRRDGDGEQDMDRITVGGAWGRHYLSQTGLVTDISLSARNDIYHVRDLKGLDEGQSSDASEVRFFPQAHMVMSYPLMRQGQQSDVVIEPVVSITAAPNIDVTNKIPNEDSQDVQLSSENLFNANRFPGVDRVEDQSRVTYGLRSGLYRHDGDQLTGFIGQSYRFDTNDSPFARGSGLSQRSSDVVGNLDGTFGAHDINYAFQFESRHLRSNRHELNTNSDFGRFSVSSQYLFAKGLEGSEFETSRQQAKLSGGYYLTPDYQLEVSGTRNLGEDEGMRKASAGLNYYGQCVSWGLIAERDYTDDDGEGSDLEVMFRLGLKNLGEFQKSKWHNNAR